MFVPLGLIKASLVQLLRIPRTVWEERFGISVNESHPMDLMAKPPYDCNSIYFHLPTKSHQKGTLQFSQSFTGFIGLLCKKKIKSQRAITIRVNRSFLDASICKASSSPHVTFYLHLFSPLSLHCA